MTSVLNTLPVEDDYPRTTFPDVPFWTESYAHWAYPKEGDFGIYVHYQRKATDPRIWKCMTTLLLDDGSAYVMKAFGPQADDSGPGPSTMKTTIRSPGENYHFVMDGCAMKVNQEDLWNGELRDTVVEAVCIDFELDALAPLWCMDASRLKAQSNAAMHAHYEQAHTSTGLIRLAGGQRKFEGYGYRDHSYGPRTYNNMGDGNLVFGVFPSGKALWFMYTENADGSAGICEGAVYCDGLLEPAQIESPPLAVKLLREPNLKYRFRTPSQEVNLNVTYLGRGMPFTLVHPAEEIIGSVGGFSALKQGYCELNLQLEWNGEIGYGSAQSTITG